MVKPSILQTLLRKPSTTYSTPLYSEDDFSPPSPSSSSFVYLSRAPSFSISNSRIKSSNSSIKSSSTNSITSTRSSPSKKKIRKSISTSFGNESGSTEQKGWEWSLYGARKELHVGESRSKSNVLLGSESNCQVDERDLRERDKNLRSYKSCESLPSRRRKKSYQDGIVESIVDARPFNREFKRSQYGEEENYLPIASTSNLSSSVPLSISDQTPSRRYSNTTQSTIPFPCTSSISTPQLPAPPTISITVTSPSPSRPLFSQDSHDLNSEYPTNESRSSSNPNKKNRPKITPLNLDTTSDELRSSLVSSPLSMNEFDDFSISSNISKETQVERNEDEGEEEEDEVESQMVSNMMLRSTGLIIAPIARSRRFSFLLDPTEETIEEEEEEEEDPDQRRNNLESEEEDDDDDIFVEFEQEEKELASLMGTSRRTSEEISRPNSIYFDSISISRHSSLRRIPDVDDFEFESENRGGGEEGRRRPTSIYFDTLDRSESIQRGRKLSGENDSLRSESIYFDAEGSAEDDKIKTVDSNTPGRVYTMDEFFSTLPPIPTTRTPSPLPPPVPPKPSHMSPTRSSFSNSPRRHLTQHQNQNSIVVSASTSSSNTSPNSPALSILSNTTTSSGTGTGWGEGSGYISPPTTCSEISRKGDEKRLEGSRSRSFNSLQSRIGSDSESENDNEGVLGKVVVRRANGWSRAVLVPRPLSSITRNDNYSVPSTTTNVVRNSSSSSNRSTPPRISSLAPPPPPPIQIVASSSPSTNLKHQSNQIYSNAFLPSEPPSSHLSSFHSSTALGPPSSSSTMTRSQSLGYSRLERSQRSHGNSGSMSTSGYAGIGLGGTLSHRSSIISFNSGLPVVSEPIGQEEQAYGGIEDDQSMRNRSLLPSNSIPFLPLNPSSFQSSSSNVSHQLSSSSLATLQNAPLPSHSSSTHFDSFRRPSITNRNLLSRGVTTSVYSVATTATTSNSFNEVQSYSGHSTRSAPIGAHRPTKNPRRFIQQNRNGNGIGTMRSIAVRFSHLNHSSPTMGISSVFKRMSSSVDFNNNNSTLSYHSISSPSSSSSHFDPRRNLILDNYSKLVPKIKKDEILVEVLAIGLDQFDYEFLKNLSSRSEGQGFVPGRAFVGRAKDCGFEVSKIKRGDLIFGMTDLWKSGALAELMIVNRNGVALAPNCQLSIEMIAALPASGIPAAQAMESICNTLPKGSKILILNAHEGVGNLCLQLAIYFRSTRDLWIIAHCPSNIIDGDKYCRTTGASDVILDEVLSTVNSLHESSIDVVIDTIGGRRIYDASRRILHFGGTFITTIGDTFESTEKKTHIRSLRRSFFKKDLKQINYWCIPKDGGEEKRNILESLRDAVERCGVRPTLKGVWDLENGIQAFVDWEGEGRVVKIVSSN